MHLVVDIFASGAVATTGFTAAIVGIAAAEALANDPILGDTTLRDVVVNAPLVAAAFIFALHFRDPALPLFAVVFAVSLPTPAVLVVVIPVYCILAAYVLVRHVVR